MIDDGQDQTQSEIHHFEPRRDIAEVVAKRNDEENIVHKLHFLDHKLHFFAAPNYTFLSDHAYIQDVEARHDKHTSTRKGDNTHINLHLYIKSGAAGAATVVVVLLLCPISRKSDKK